jgi:uncharacterized protein DUF6883
MSAPTVGQPLPRAEDAYVEDEKWNGYVIADVGHGREWRRVFGPIDSGDLWAIIATAVLTSDVTEIRDLGQFGVSCRVPINVTINEHTAPVRTVWHYENDRAAPRLVTAYPTP